MKTFIIAEIGSAWQWKYAGTIVEAGQAIAIAKSCGADAIKFQWVSDPRKMEHRRCVNKGSYDLLAWGKGKLDPIARECRESGIEFMCTVFLREDVKTLDPYVQRWKVASLEREDAELLSAMRGTQKPIIASHGAADSIRWNRRAESLSLHCTAAYPAPLDSLNLLVIETENFDGYSDHSCNELTGALAVACGAKIVEVHFKLLGTPIDNPDYGHSLWPEQLRHYIANIRQAEQMLGDGHKKIEPCEEWALKHKVRG